MEKYVLSIMTSFRETFAVITDTQYVFRPRRSTIKLLEDFPDHIHGAPDNNQFNFALLLDSGLVSGFTSEDRESRTSKTTQNNRAKKEKEHNNVAR